ncbi:MAG TPA: M14 family metallopeptidase [Anaerolineales bacterium]|nr:M14 family metallopeptidase [Anaerolineales bacterium]
MTDIQSLFPKTYEASRERFRSKLPGVQAMWPKAKLFQHRLSGNEDLTIDWIYSEALENNDKVLLFTTGEHGVEGYVGSAMMQLFIEKHMPKLNPRTTGILFVHAINPWGMKHHRRGNRDNIDLNRTFLWNVGHDPDFNPDYDKIRRFLNPGTKVTNLFLDNIAYTLQLFWNIARMGMKNFRYALLLGQYRDPKGLYYGGTARPDETQTLMDLYKQMMISHDQILHLDMHTGYGPRYQMSLVNSALDKGTSEYFVKRFNYPLVVAATADEFYAIRGDMIDYIYALRQNEFPQKRLYATSFEFGTLGDTFYGLLQSPRVMTHENRAYWHGAQNESLLARAKYGFEELFYPEAKDWREKAVADGDRAFTGILKAEGYIP